MSKTDSRYCFVAEYFDPQANLVRQYQLLYFLTDNTVEMYDMKNKRMFLKRCPVPSLTLKELYVGATVNVYSRLLKLVDYGDIATRQAMSSSQQEAMVVVYGDGLKQVGNIMTKAMALGLRTHNARFCKFSDKTATDLRLPRTCYVLTLMGDDAATKAQQLAKEHPSSIGCVPQEAIEAVSTEAYQLSAPTARLSHDAVCVIKPHIISAGKGGEVLQRILDEGFDITAFGIFTLTFADAEDFLEVYKGVVPEYNKLVEHMCSGPCWAMELHAEDSVASLRALAGPHDPEICKVLFPTSIRAWLGVDRVYNAVHCTDLPEDGPLEAEFFFSLLAKKA